MTVTMSSETLTKSKYLGERLKQELASWEQKKGKKFYTIPQIKDRFSVSPVTAFKAVSGLVKDGYLTSRRGSGYFVANKPVFDDLHPSFKSSASQTKRILLIGDSEEITQPKMSAGLRDACSKAKYRLELLPFDTPDLTSISNEPDVAGIVIEAGQRTIPLAQINKPKIVIGHWPNLDDGVRCFIADAEQASIDTVSYLCGLGHNRIAILLADLRSDWQLPDENISHFVAGFRKGYQIYNLPWDEDLIWVNRQRPQREYICELVHSFREKEITAAFIPEWGTMIAFIQELHRSGMDVPADISLVAYGDSEFSKHIYPRLTTFDVFIRDISRKAGEVIIGYDRNEIELPTQKYVKFPAELIIGESAASLYATSVT